MPNATYIALIPLLPLAGFVLLGLFGRKYFQAWSGIIGTTILLVVTMLSIWVAWSYFGQCMTEGFCRQTVPLKLTWLSFSPGVSIDMSIVLDPISVMMIVVVSLVSLMVHLFSLSYMKGEERFGTYYAFLGL